MARRGPLSRRDGPARAPLRLALVLAAMGAAGGMGAAEEAVAQIPALPAGGHSRWVVEGPEEVVTYLLFDPSTVSHRLPASLRFVTVGDIADLGLGWATEHLSSFPDHRHWGISFLEIVRASTFSIDGRSPKWPDGGAAGLWFARVAPADPGLGPGPGQPYLELGFWLPDSAYVAYMNRRGYFARYGRVRLDRDPDGTWRGSIVADGLEVAAACSPTGGPPGSAGSAGSQVLFPPADAAGAALVRVAFAGHRIQPCVEERVWTIQGTHPLSGADAIGGSTLQSGYVLHGAVYPP